MKSVEERVMTDNGIGEVMMVRRLATVVAALVLALYTPALSAMYTIENPADKINNPAEKIYNPATDIKNPAATIYNPAARMDNPNPLSPPTHPVPAAKSADQLNGQAQTKPRRAIPHKNYHFKTVKAYISAAKNAFIQDDYLKFLLVTEDALRRIQAGTLKASEKAKQKLEKYRVFGYGLLEKEK
jgi:hypothetical protein